MRSAASTTLVFFLLYPRTSKEYYITTVLILPSLKHTYLYAARLPLPRARPPRGGAEHVGRAVQFGARGGRGRALCSASDDFAGGTRADGYVHLFVMGQFSILLVPCFIWSATLETPDLHLSYNLQYTKSLASLTSILYQLNLTCLDSEF